MERPPFFPDPYFGWTFCVVLVALTGLGAYLDLRKAVLPKWLTLTALALGIVFNIVRGAWLGQAGNPLWLLPTGSVWMGALDGLLFTLSGFASATVLFIFLWMMKTCGGGDVKLFAAIGAWVGFVLVVFIMLASVLVMVVLLVARLLGGGLTPMRVQKRLKDVQVIKGGPGKGKWRMTYAFPVAIATVLVLLWFFRVELQLAAPRVKAVSTQMEAPHD